MTSVGKIQNISMSSCDVTDHRRQN